MRDNAITEIQLPTHRFAPSEDRCVRDAELIGRELRDLKKICAIYFLDIFYNKRISFVKTNEERLININFQSSSKK